MQVIQPKEFCRFGKKVYECKTIITKKIGDKTLKGTGAWTFSYKLSDASQNPEVDKVIINNAKDQILKNSKKKAIVRVHERISKEIEKLANKKYGSPELRKAAREERIIAAEKKAKQKTMPLQTLDDKTNVKNIVAEESAKPKTGQVQNNEEIIDKNQGTPKPQKRFLQMFDRLHNAKATSAEKKSKQKTVPPQNSKTNAKSVAPEEIAMSKTEQVQNEEGIEKLKNKIQHTAKEENKISENISMLPKLGEEIKLVQETPPAVQEASQKPIKINKQKTKQKVEVSEQKTQMPEEAKQNTKEIKKEKKQAKKEKKAPFTVVTSKLAALGEGFAGSLNQGVVSQLSERIKTRYGSAETILTTESSKKNRLFPVIISVYEKNILNNKKGKKLKTIGKSTVGTAYNPPDARLCFGETYTIVGNGQIYRQAKTPPRISGNGNVKPDANSAASAHYPAESFIKALTESRNNARKQMTAMIQKLANKKYGNQQKRIAAREIRRNQNTLNKNT